MPIPKLRLEDALGLAGPGELEVAERIETDAGDRDGNKRQAAQAVLDLLGRHVG